MGAAELFLGSSASLYAPLREVGIPSLCIGAVLERQIQGLTPSRWKSSVGDALLGLVNDLLQVYEDRAFSGHRARAILRKLELLYFIQPSADKMQMCGKELLDLTLREVG